MSVYPLSLLVFLMASSVPVSPAPNGTEVADRAQVEVMHVRARRLEPAGRSEPDPRVLRLDEDDLDSPQGSTVQDILAEHPQVLVYDQVGNGLEQEVDVRGFSGGNHLAVFLDGVRINAPDDNRADLEFLFLQDAETLELRLGAGSSLFGSGAGAGVLRIRSRRPSEDAGVESWVRAGSHRLIRGGVRGGGRVGGMRISAAAQADGSEGPRTNSDWRRRAARIRAEGEVAGGSLGFSFHHTDLDAGNPQSLTEEEWLSDPESAPFNGTDRHRGRLDLGVLSWDGSRGDWDLTGHIALQSRSDRILTTGRLGRGRRGFLTDTTIRSVEGVGQAARSFPKASLVAGIEHRRSQTHARSWDTDIEGEDRLPAGDTNTRHSVLGVFVEGAWRPAEAWRLDAGARFDEVRLEMGGLGLDPASQDLAPLRGARSYRVASPSLSLVRTWDGENGAGRLVLAGGRGHFLPTPNQLFAFPGFSSNPDLEPTSIDEWSMGFLWTWDRGMRLGLTAFRMEADDEVFFDLDDPRSAFGRNVGRDTRRTGTELTLRWTPGSKNRWVLDVGYTWLDAEFREAFRTAHGDRVRPGDAVPLVPRHKVGMMVSAELPSGWRIRLHGRWIGSRPMDNDPAGTAEPLGSHHVWDLAATGPVFRDAAARLALSVKNLLGRRYATRGIAHAPDQNLVPRTFFTPATGRTVEAALRWTF